MTTLIISDTHFTKRFDKRRFSKLVELINKADKVIINGDFWEGMSISFNNFMHSEWNKLFPYLKAKDTVYVYGNHDDKRLSDDRVYEFCNEAVDCHKLETPTRTYFFTHGQEFLYPHMKDKDSSVKRAQKFLTKVDIFVAGILQKLIFQLFGPNALPKKFNNMSKEIRESVAPLEHLLVCGHSHTPQHKPELNFMDIGFFNYGWANYLLIDHNGDFEFKSERY